MKSRCLNGTRIITLVASKYSKSSPKDKPTAPYGWILGSPLPVSVSPEDRMLSPLTKSPTEVWRRPLHMLETIFSLSPSCTIHLVPLSTTVLPKETFLNCRTEKKRSKEVCVSSASADWLTAACHSNLGDTLLDVGTVITFLQWCTEARENSVIMSMRTFGNYR